MVYVPFYQNKVTHKQEKEVMHTYGLFDAQISMKATKLSKVKRDIIRWLLLESFFRVFVSLCFPVAVNNLQCFFGAYKKVDCKTESS